MPKIYVAEPAIPTDGVETKYMASGSLTTIKQRIGENLDSRWIIKTWQLKADVPMICGLIEGKFNGTVEETELVEVNANGRVRTIKDK